MWTPLTPSDYYGCLLYTSGVSWFVEGDIKGCFDNIDHHILVNILKRRIKDEAFIDLIWKLLRAGYLEDWMKHQTYSGTPQGSGVSPLLANIYLNELDLFMERYRTQFNKGDKRRFSNDYVNANHHYARTRERNAKKWNTMSEEERKGAKVMQKKLQAILLSTPSREPMDPNYRRVLYVRYADDFLIGVIGSRADAEQVKTAVSNFLKQELNLTMSPEKTLITHGHDTVSYTHLRGHDRLSCLRGGRSAGGCDKSERLHFFPHPGHRPHPADVYKRQRLTIPFTKRSSPSSTRRKMNFPGICII